MSDISRAIKAKQAEIKKLRADIEALRRAAGIISKKQPTIGKRKRSYRRSAAARKAASRRMKAYWAKKKSAV